MSGLALPLALKLEPFPLHVAVYRLIDAPPFGGTCTANTGPQCSNCVDDDGDSKIDGFDPGVLVIALGLDAHEADPLRGGNVTQAGFARLAEQIASLGLPTVIAQEGGYLTEHLSDNLAVFLTSYEGALSVPVHETLEDV